MITQAQKEEITRRIHLLNEQYIDQMAYTQRTFDKCKGHLSTRELAYDAIKLDSIQKELEGMYYTLAILGCEIQYNDRYTDVEITWEDEVTAE